MLGKSSKRYLKMLPEEDTYTDERILKEKVEVEYGRESYDEGEINGTIEDYGELMVQFGFIAMFSIALPIIPLLAFINNIFEMLIDKNKVIHLTRRPVPAVAKSSGIFVHVFSVISFLAIFTNLGIMSFTGEAFGEFNTYNSFLWFTIGALFFKFFLSETIPDYSESTYNVMERHKVIVKKSLVNMYKDDDAGNFKVERISLDVLFTEKAGGTVDDSAQNLKNSKSRNSGAEEE